MFYLLKSIVLSPIVEEYLYSAMEDFKIDIMIESGPNARTVQINLNHLHSLAQQLFRLLTAPMRARFVYKVDNIIYRIVNHNRTT
jgi:Holliday junction resolvasome RuvABC ATP-dependent DNA helicase subunit